MKMHVDISGRLPFSMIRAIAPVILIVLFIHTFAQSSANIVLSVDWNNTGTKIAAGYDTGVQHRGLVEVIDSSTGQILRSFQFPGFIAEVMWSPHDSDLLAAAANYIDMPGTIHILNTATGQEIMTLAEGEQILSITWKPDGSSLAASIGYTTSPGISRYITIWDTSTWQVSNDIVIGPVDAFSLDWSPDGNHIASGEDDGIITLWDANTGTIDSTFTGHTSAVYSVAWSPDGSRLASTSSLEDPTIRIWDIATGQNILVIPSGALDIAWSPDGTRIAAADINEIVTIWDVSTGQLVDTITQADDVYAVAWSPDGSMLALGNASGGVQIVDAPSIVSCDLTIPASDATSLLSAITTANGAGTPQTLCLTNSTYMLDTAPAISGDITLLGDGATLVLESGGGLDVAEGASLSLEGVTVIGGQEP